MIYTIYNLATGRIDCSLVVANPQAVAAQFDANTQGILDGSWADGNHYVQAGVVQTMPVKPTPQHTRFDYALLQWCDPRTLATIKAQQWALVKAARTAAEYAGFTWDGSTFDSDATSQARITGAVTLAQLSSTFTIDWTLADNSVRTLSQADMLAVGAALGLHVQTQFAQGQALRQQIEAATTQAEVEAVVWV